VRDGAGWTISVMDPEGTMVLAVAGDGLCGGRIRRLRAEALNISPDGNDP
jgi:hypothetical protein